MNPNLQPRLFEEVRSSDDAVGRYVESTHLEENAETMPTSLASRGFALERAEAGHMRVRTTPSFSPQTVIRGAWDGLDKSIPRDTPEEGFYTREALLQRPLFGRDLGGDDSRTTSNPPVPVDPDRLTMQEKDDSGLRVAEFREGDRLVGAVQYLPSLYEEGAARVNFAETFPAYRGQGLSQHAIKLWQQRYPGTTTTPFFSETGEKAFAKHGVVPKRTRSEL